MSLRTVNAEAANAQATDTAELLTALHHLDQLLERAVRTARSVYGVGVGEDPYRGLYINEEEIKRLLTREPGRPVLWPEGQAEGAALQEEFLTSIGSMPSLVMLAETFGLSVFDTAAVLIALATEVDLRYERLFAYLQDDVTRRRPSVDLVLNLLCTSVEEKLARRTHFAAEAPLLRHGLLQLIPDNSQNQTPLLNHSLKLDDQITHRLLGQRVFDSRLATFCQLIRSNGSLNELPLNVEMKRTLWSLIEQARKTRRPMRLYFPGPNYGDKHRVARVLAREIGAPLLRVELNHPRIAEMDFRQALKLVFREATFHEAVMYLDGFDALMGERGAFQQKLLSNALSEHNGIVILPGEQASIPTLASAGPEALGLITVPFHIPGFELRRECWGKISEAAGLNLLAEEIDALAGRFRLTPDQIAEAVAEAQHKGLSRAGDEDSDEAITSPATHSAFMDICAAARAQSGHLLTTLARKIEPVYDWSDIVLPDDALAQLRELCQRVEQRQKVMNTWGFGRKLSLGKGVSALFAGPSGTGKTMAAEIIARELGLDLYKIDLSGVVSKYIGETEKNLDRIFAAAENSNAIVFIDECDSLMGKRSEVRDAHDRYANIEISYLLQKMEEYEGIVILATNLRQNLDESFMRRLAFTVHFPFPDDKQRRQIWDGIWPEAMPLANDLDLDFLSRQFKFSGGNIKNVALAAAFLAAADGNALTMAHLIRATRREFQKLGKPLAASELGSFANHLTV